MNEFVPIEIQVAGGGCINAIPAVHYAAKFALGVHQLAEYKSQSNSSERMAVAIELGPATAICLAAWIKELGAEKPLPNMLGLVRENKFIHPKYKEASLRLQEFHGLPLHQIPVALLHQELHYSSSSLLCLSATDSIIEAVRCAVQYGFDLYGIDLEDFAACEHKETLLVDTSTINKFSEIDQYVKLNAERYASSRDPMIDERREQVMAARLKGIAQEYDSVLYTGGIAHWNELKKRLNDPELKAVSPLTNIDRSSEFKRIIVNPSLAISYMDALPAYTAYYEIMRIQPYGTPWSDFGLQDKALEQIKRAYAAAAMDENGQYDGLVLDHSHDFWFYLNNISLLRQQVVPRLKCVIEAATAIISEKFALQLGKELVYAPELNWLQAEDKPELPYLHSLSSDDSEYELSDGHKVELVSSSGSDEPFYMGGSPNGVTIDRKFQETLTEHHVTIQSKKSSTSRIGYSNPWIWPPSENLFYGTAYHVAEHIMPPTSSCNGEPFSGTMAEGIDIRATIRAATRHDQRIYVKVASGSRLMSQKQILSEPFVYIFQNPQVNRSRKVVDWDVLYAGSDNVKAHHFKSKAAKAHYNEIKKNHCSNFVAGVQFTESREPPDHLANCDDIKVMRLLWGAISFGNPCVNIYQCARWLEDTNFKCSPILKDLRRNTLVTFYKDNFDMTLDMENWPENLIRIAIPYASRRVLIMAPDRKAITRQVQMDARNFGVDIDIVPLSYISAERINMIRQQHVVYPLNVDATDWSKEIISLLGPVGAHQELLPYWIQSQTVQNN